MLIKAGADKDARTGGSGASPLHLAARKVCLVGGGAGAGGAIGGWELWVCRRGFRGSWDVGPRKGGDDMSPLYLEVPP